MMESRWEGGQTLQASSLEDSTLPWSVCRIDAQHGGSPAVLLLHSTSSLARKDDKGGWSRQPAGTRQTRPWRGQDIVLPEVAAVASATGASKNIPRDSPGSSGPGSFLVAQQYEDIKKINLSAQMVLQPPISPLLRAGCCAELTRSQSERVPVRHPWWERVSREGDCVV